MYLKQAQILLVSVLGLVACSAFAAPRVVLSKNATPREQFGASRLRAAVAGLSGDETILLAQRNDPLMKPYDERIPDFWPDAKEAYLLRRIDSSTIIATSYDASGTLYAALDLADRVAANHALPA